MKITRVHTLITVELAVVFIDPETPGECELAPLKLRAGGFIQPNSVLITLRRPAPDGGPLAITGDTVSVQGWRLTARRKLRLDRLVDQRAYHTSDPDPWPHPVARVYRNTLQHLGQPPAAGRVVWTGSTWPV